MLRRLTAAAGLTGCVLLSGCAHPAATFTSARTLPQGGVEGGAFVDVPLGFQVGTRQSDPSSTSGGYSSLVTGGSLQVGVLPWLQVGGRLGTGLLELNSQVQLWAGRRFAFAVAPRFQSTLLFAPYFAPYLARAPFIASVEPSTHTSLAVRAGLGYSFGVFDEHWRTWDFGGSSSGPHKIELSAPVVELGACGIVWVSDHVGLSLDGYLISSFLDPSVLVPGGGFAVLFGSPRRPAP